MFLTHSPSSNCGCDNGCKNHDWALACLSNILPFTLFTRARANGINALSRVTKDSISRILSKKLGIGCLYYFSLQMKQSAYFCHLLYSPLVLLEHVPRNYGRPWLIFSSQEMFVLSKGPGGWDLEPRPQIFECYIPHLKPFLCTSFQTCIGVLVDREYTCRNFQI